MVYIDSAVEGSELRWCKIKGDENSVVSQMSLRMDVTLLEQLWIMRC